jgi:hypothetical protein
LLVCVADLELDHTFILSHLIAYAAVAGRGRTVAMNTYSDVVTKSLFRTYVVSLEATVFTHRGVGRSERFL